MSDKNMLIKPVAAAVGVAFVSSFAFSTAAVAADNPFAAADLDSGYLLAGDGETEEGKCGEGKCGEGIKKSMEEGKCGMSRMDANGDGNITREEFMKGHEGKFDSMDTNGDGMIDSNEQAAHMKEGKCGAGKMGQEGKCGAEKKSAE